MAAPFLRRIQTTPMVPVLGTTLLDAFSAALLGGMGWGGAAMVFSLYEIEFIGSGWIPGIVGSFAFVKMLGWYRLKGEGIVRKDGIYRYQQSRKINRILGPGATDAPDLFVVVTATDRRTKEPLLQAFFNTLAYGLGLKKKPQSSHRTSGDQYCLQVARRYRAMQDNQLRES